MKPFLFNTIENDEILDRCRKMNIELMESPYSFKGKSVPRVTTILSDMLSEEYLMTWANNVGLYQRKKHTYYKNKATNIGSHVHSAIEAFTQGDPNPENIANIKDADDRKKAMNAYSAFLDWWEVIEKTRYEVLMQEAPLVTSYCGGTLDMLININGKIYIVDFKTSGQLSFKYYVQLAAYRRMLYDLYNIVVDGIILLRLDKGSGKFEEVILDFSDYESLLFINQCDQLFISILYGYYNRFIVENNTQFIKK